MGQKTSKTNGSRVKQNNIYTNKSINQDGSISPLSIRNRLFSFILSPYLRTSNFVL